MGSKDGATVAKEVELPGHSENMGAQMVREGVKAAAGMGGMEF